VAHWRSGISVVHPMKLHYYVWLVLRMVKCLGYQHNTHSYTQPAILMGWEMSPSAKGSSSALW